MPVKKTQRRKSTGKPARSNKRRYLLGFAALLLALLGAYLGYLNYLINARFEGGAWALPSRVYARALELYPGLTLTRDNLAYELELSSYLRVDSEPLPGEYRQLGASLEFNSRPFAFTDQQQPARLIQVFFDAGRVSGLVDSHAASELAVFRLPPFMLGSYYPQSGEDRLLLAVEDVPEQLYDTFYDPGEANNLAGSPKHAEIKADLSARLDRWMRETNDPILDGPVLVPEGGYDTPQEDEHPGRRPA